MRTRGKYTSRQRRRQQQGRTDQRALIGEALEPRRLLAAAPWVDLRVTATDLQGAPLQQIGAGQDFYVEVEVSDLRSHGLPGVFAAYLDMEFDPGVAQPVADPTNPYGFDLQFGSDYGNGHSGQVTNGLLDEIGGFQSGLGPLGHIYFDLFKIRMTAQGVSVANDVFRNVPEDSPQITLDVLQNDQIQEQSGAFTASPADDLPAHEVLMFDPTSPVDQSLILYGNANLDIVDDGSLKIESVSAGSAGGTISIAPNGRELLYQPAPDFNGQETFTYQVTGGWEAEGMVLVRPSNDAPIAVADQFDVSHLEPTTIVADAGVLQNDVDIDGDALTAELVTQPQNGSVTMQPDGSLLYTPNGSFRGNDQFTYRVSDGELSSEPATVSLAIDPIEVSLRLEATDADGLPITEVAAGETFQLTGYVQDQRGGGGLGVYATYVDILFNADVVEPVQSNGDLDYQALGGYENGVEPVLEQGAIRHAGGFQRGNVAQGPFELPFFSLTFQATQPLAVDDLFPSQPEDTGQNLKVLANDVPSAGVADFRLAPSESPRFDIVFHNPASVATPNTHLYQLPEVRVDAAAVAKIVDVSAPVSQGQVLISEDGQSIDYQPGTNFTGVDTFSYTLDNGTSASVQIESTPVNDAPQVTADSYETRQNQILTIAAAEGLLQNDSDVEGDALTAELWDNPQRGTVQVFSDGSFRYQPPAGETGFDEFLYRVFDGQDYSEPVAVQVTIHPPPIEFALQALDQDGEQIDQLVAGDSFTLRATVEDQRLAATGLYAAYLDVTYDPTLATSASDIQFGDEFGAGRTGELSPGMFDEVGAFRAGLSAPTRMIQQLFDIDMQSAGPRVFDDAFAVSSDSRMNYLPVLDNELQESWSLTFQPDPADVTPAHDTLLYSPAQAVDRDEMRFTPASLQVSNPDGLTLASVTQPGHGTITLGDDQQTVLYIPNEGFAGSDSFQYTFTASNGQQYTGNVAVEVSVGWQNALNQFDVNSDASIAPSDALAIINDLNENGSRPLEPVASRPPFIDVSGDAFVSPVDVLMVVNHLNTSSGAGEGESLSLFVPATATPTPTPFKHTLTPIAAQQSESSDFDYALQIGVNSDQTDRQSSEETDFAAAIDELLEQDWWNES